ncbi:hypothetical protein IAU59_006953 [Kwoniella sp. CBS 9459]
MRSPFSPSFFQHRNKSFSSPPNSAEPTSTTTSVSTTSKRQHSNSPHQLIDHGGSAVSLSGHITSAQPSLNRSKMGQNNGKFEFEPPHPHYAKTPQSAFSSPGPDPFHYSPQHTRPAPPPPVIAPEFYHAPHSAPVVPTTSTTSKPRGLIRTLSAKRRGESPRKPQFDDLPPIGSLKALKTLGQADARLRMKDFEALVARAEAEAGLTQDETVPPNSPTSKRVSIGRGLGLDEHTPSPVPLSATPAYLRPAPHRRSSTSSIHSSRASIKSARRAEREWRAKVAALSSGFSPYYHTSPKAHRSKGPVPPRRALGSAAALSASQTSRSMSPTTEEGGTIIVTPPHNTSASFSTPLSNKSFETLGHYPNASPADGPPSPSPTGEWEARSRKPSVPHSAVSSMYEPRPRTSSLASSQLLAPSPLRVDTMVRASQEVKAAPTISPSSCYSASDASPTTPHAQGRDLPPFESFQSSPRMVGSSALPEACTTPVRRGSSVAGHLAGESKETGQEEAEREVQVKTEREVSGVWEIKDVSIPSPVSPPTDERKHRSLPSPPRTQSRMAVRPSLYIDASEISSLPPMLPPLASLPPLSAPCTPVHATPRRPVKAQGPPTPYSPTTAYILSAESASLDQMTWSTSYALFAASPQKQLSKSSPDDGYDPHTPVKAKHPFTIGAKPSPGPPSPLLTSSEPVERGVSSSTLGDELTGAFIPSRDHFVSVPMPQPGPSQTLPRRASAHTDQFIPRQLPSTLTHNSNSLPSRHKPVIRPQVETAHHDHGIPSTFSSANKLGTMGKNEERVRESGISRSRAKVDLTPGMEDGCRPPKSGLPMSDLAKWLAETAISS